MKMMKGWRHMTIWNSFNKVGDKTHKMRRIYTQKREISVVIAFAFLLCVTLAPNDCMAVAIPDASAHAASGTPHLKASDSDSTWFLRVAPAIKAQIDWKVPTFTADGVTKSTAPVPFSEPKFDTTTTSSPLGYTWMGYDITQSEKSSTVSSTGTGSSSVGFTYSADWTVTASGSGTYDAKAEAKDPWSIFPSDLSQVSTSNYSAYIPFSILGGHSDTTGTKISSEQGYNVTYATASGSTTLLDVLVKGTDAIVTPATTLGSSLKFFLEPDSTTFPTGSTIPGTEIASSDLKSLVSSHLDLNGNLVSPINLGIVLSGIPVPSTLMKDGSVAQFQVTALASESAAKSAAAPEPSTLLLYGTGIAGLGLAACWRHRRYS